MLAFIVHPHGYFKNILYFCNEYGAATQLPACGTAVHQNQRQALEVLKFRSFSAHHSLVHLELSDTPMGLAFLYLGWAFPRVRLNFS